MLPYGRLWQLDQQLHPSGPPRRRTPALRRRQALFYMIFTCAMLTLFLIPWHFAHIRRSYLHHKAVAAGLIVPTTPPAALDADVKAAVAALRQRLERHGTKGPEERDTDEDEDGAAEVLTQWSQALYYHPQGTAARDPTTLTLLKTIGGLGGGRLWPLLGDEAATPNNPHLQLVAAEGTPAAVASLPRGQWCVGQLRAGHTAGRQLRRLLLKQGVALPANTATTATPEEIAQVAEGDNAATAVAADRMEEGSRVAVPVKDMQALLAAMAAGAGGLRQLYGACSAVLRPGPEEGRPLGCLCLADKRLVGDENVVEEPVPDAFYVPLSVFTAVHGAADMSLTRTVVEEDLWRRQEPRSTCAGVCLIAGAGASHSWDTLDAVLREQVQSLYQTWWG